MKIVPYDQESEDVIQIHDRLERDEPDGHHCLIPGPLCRQWYPGIYQRWIQRKLFNESEDEK